MTRFISVLTLILSLTLSSGVHSRELVVAVSPYMEKATAKEQTKEVLKFLTALEPGDKAALVDGYSLAMIGIFTIPENPTYKSPKARLAVNRAAVAALLRFADSAKLSNGNNGPSVAGALRLPHLLRHIAENFPAQGQREVVILGSPVYEDLDTPALSMTEERFPGDGHLLVSTTTTPYGAAGNAELLAGFNIHIGYGAQGLPGSDRHDEFVRRFWTLFIEKQDGTLSGFVRDLPTLFQGVLNNAPALKHNYVPTASDKLEMIRLAPVEIKQSIFDREVSAAPLPVQQTRRAEHVQIGLSWTCSTCDLDLYAQAHPGAVLLYFGNTSSPQGRYWKDYTNSPETTNGQETIAFTAPLDLRALRLGINFYSGTAAGGADGEVRISIGGKTYAANLHIEATEGNKGIGMLNAMKTGQAANSQTLFINPLKVVGL